MTYKIRTVTPWGDVLPVIGLEEAKNHLRVQHTDDDTLIPSLVLTAMDHVERSTGHILTLREMEMVLDRFPSRGGIVIPREPIVDVFGLSYEDEAGASVTITDYVWSTAAPDRVRLATSWPYGGRNVRVQFEAGYMANAAPPALVGAVKLLLGDFYSNRENSVPGSLGQIPLGVDALLHSYRSMVL